MPKPNGRKLHQLLISKFSNSLSRLSYLPQTFKLIWAASHYWTLAWVVLLIIQGLLPAVTVFLTRLLVDSLVEVVGAGISGQAISIILVPAALMVGVLLLTELLGNLLQWIRTAQTELAQDYISALVHTKSTEVDLAFYESSEFYDHLDRARSDASGRSLSLLENSGSLLQNSITMMAMAAILFPYGAWLPIILVASTLPAFYVIVRLNRRHHQWWQKTTTDRRRLQYYELLLTISNTAAEIRLFDLGSYFQSAYQKLRSRMRTEHLKLIRDQSLGRFGAGILALLISGIALLWMGRQVLLGLITLGDLALFYQAFNRGQGLIKSLLGNLGQIYQNSLFISNLFEFLQLEPKIINPLQATPIPSRLRQGIEFREVTFRYPGSERAVLENFNLTIPVGKIVAIVGDNGAGKSTLTKLLCRFYDPESGSVELDGNDLRNFEVEELRRQITMLFQSPVPYYLTAAENIKLGDLSVTPTQAEIETAARVSGIHDKITSLPQGYHSLMGKWFPGGNDLSGGEWQRLALARSFLRHAQIIILDEPTSAMDPWAEFDWLERFRKLANGRTAIVITHRFTLAMRADIIHVMRAGQIVESGNHDQLITQDGLYAQSWQAQMQASSSKTIQSSLT
ncbi:MAG: ABC transporter ATP-binding protein [Symploca sp. SIO3C6]|uniref:ABC transporter ATP-binding protein n=1 Tax=Symploca sp. SIO1C4 TaxID=2607765 RepID=A0A6B3N6H9_9CYAN|nr:ABC transporter ATP-binding protein [Symploca sp. SIO3C6]NER27187.1 ABC transporter ATP-binding protein [Symploca sp. SIO1C4]NET04895.1 ABC transporter ATP-binding protein [Symploca sp. SIO2B6]